MNQGTITGGVVKAGESAYTVATAEAPSMRRVLFAIAVSDSKKASAFWNCEAEGDDILLDWIEGECRPGRGIKLDFELATRPFFKKGVRTGEVRFLRVIRAEFMDRQAKAAEPVEVDA